MGSMKAIGALALVALCLLPGTGFAQDWPLWRHYADGFIQKDGRTIDHASADATTSEGQAYSLFFALVDGDRATFDRVLAWTQNNLAGGDLSARLPAWRWGRRKDGSWGVLDENAASDADMWLAYALLEAGRLWQVDRYDALGQLVLARIGKEEIADIKGLGPMLIPGPKGFSEGGTWRLNPSYFPLMQLRRFSAYDRTWGKIAVTALKTIEAASPHRLVPDWIAYREGAGFSVDPVKGDEGSYDAIRVYLWAGMLDGREKLKAPLLKAIGAMKVEVDKNLVPPLRVHAASGKAEGSGPPGFTAALLPYLDALKEKRLLALQQDRMRASRFGALVGADPKYYDQVLSMFGEGWIEGRFRFDDSGHLLPAWKKP